MKCHSVRPVASAPVLERSISIKCNSISSKYAVSYVVYIERTCLCRSVLIGGYKHDNKLDSIRLNIYRRCAS